ncbi:MAG: MFS transporter [Candidatus Taylorbacteria bacterium]|nr:MFS transporter [Candidatus Taylorbacteria bacterium]
MNRLLAKTRSLSYIFTGFLPFWFFLLLFKFGGGLHYSLISPLGEKFFPLWLVGILMGGCSVVQLLLDVPAGHLLDRFGYLRFLKITTAIFLIAALSLTLGLTKITYLLSLLFSIFGWLFFGPGLNAYVLSHAPRESAGRFMSVRDVFGSIGVVLSSAALPIVLTQTPQMMGAVIFFLLLISLFFLFFSPKDHTSVHAEQKLPTQHHYIRRQFILTTLRAMKRLNPASGMLLLVSLSSSIFYGCIWFVVPLIIAHQASAGLLGLGLGIFDFSIVVLGFLLGNLADRSDKRALIFFGLLLFSISGMLLGFNFGWLFLLFGFLATSGDEMASISLWSWLHSLDHEHASDGVVASVITLFQDLGWAIGPMLAGVAYTLVGPSLTIVIGSIPVLLTWVVYQFVVRKHGRRHISFSLLPAKPHRARHKT